MDASSSSTFFTSSGVPQSPVHVSQEEFALFHNIDRKLFSRLVFALGRDPGESAQIVALWMWLEHAGQEFNMVYKLCANLPDTILNAVADESVMALNCIQSDEINVDLSKNRDIPILNALTKNGVTLKYFHQNRLGIIRGVTKLFSEVCMRAFDDLLPKPHPNQFHEGMILNPGMIGVHQQNPNMMMSANPHVNLPYNPLLHNPAAAMAYDIPAGGSSSNMGPFPNQRMMHGGVAGGSSSNMVPFPNQRVMHGGVAGGSSSNMVPFPNQRVMHEGVVDDEQSLGPYYHIHLMTRAATRGDAALDYLRGIFDPYDLAAQRQILNEEMGGLLSRLNLNDDHRQEVEDLSADERTIFLTFSKGYPISENEVREFFSRRFGDFIDGVYMQDVPAEEQPLYARLVVRSASSIPIVLDGKSKAKFSINGKHVWARKYVRKNPGEPSSPAATQV